MTKRRALHVLGSVAVVGLIAVSHAQMPSPGRGRGGGTPIPGATDPPKMIFHEGWTRAPLSQPITQSNLANQSLTLHIYGDANQIRKAMHPLDDYT